MPRLPLNFSQGLSFRDQLLGLLHFLGLNSCACLDVLVISCFVKSNSLVLIRRRLALVLNSKLTNCLNFTECPADARSSIEMQKKQMSTVSKEDKEQEEEDADEEEEDEESEVLQCDSNPILLRLKKKKINGNGFEAGEPSAGIRGSKHKIERDPHSRNTIAAFPQCTGLLLFPLTRKFTTTPHPNFPQCNAPLQSQSAAVADVEGKEEGGRKEGKYERMERRGKGK